MSKRITVPWYVVAWVVWLIAAVGYFAMVRSAGSSTSGPSGGLVVASIVAFLTGIVMLVMVIGALVKLGMQRAWGWFVAVLILQLIGLGIIGMALYGIWGPADSSMGVATRPTAAG